MTIRMYNKKKSWWLRETPTPNIILVIYCGLLTISMMIYIPKFLKSLGVFP